MDLLVAVMLLSLHMLCSSWIFNYFEQITLERLKRIQWVCGLHKHIAKPNTCFLMTQKIPAVKQLAYIPDYVVT